MIYPPRKQKQKKGPLERRSRRPKCHELRTASHTRQVLSNPTKRQTYDDQRRAVKRKKQGESVDPFVVEFNGWNG